MKQTILNFVQKIDALTLRERVVVFAMLATLALSIINIAVLDKQFAKQKKLAQQVNSNQAQITLIQAETVRKVAAHTDPDVVNRARLAALQREAAPMRTSLLDMQKGLVSPDKMPLVLEEILKRDGTLRLLSMKTLPPVGLTDAAAAAAVAADNAAKAAAAAADAKSPKKPGAAPQQVNAANPTGAVYKHGVEIVVQGGYLDMVRYMAELEAMPWQLFWGQAKLNVDEYPKATLTLTLFTLSLDKTWLNL